MARQTERKRERERERERKRERKRGGAIDVRDGAKSGGKWPKERYLKK